MEPEVLSVSELNHFIKDVISSGFSSSLWVCGEIQNLDRYRSKAHLFFELVEKEKGANEIKAKLGVTIWAGVRPKIEALLKKAENAFELKDGIEVKFSGKVDFYPPYGTLRFVIDNIDPVYTLGKIAQDRQRLIDELTRAGVLARNKSVVLGTVPLRVGLITAFDSAAYNDFIHELRQSRFAFTVFLYNAVMQGKNCEASVCAGLKVLTSMDDLDVIVITRGGGSIAELSAFDSKAIAMAVAGSRYPVVTGIGHEINTSVADLAAHTFAKTPTAVAQFLSNRVKEYLDTLVTRESSLFSASSQCVQSQGPRLKEEALNLQHLLRGLLQSFKENHARNIQRLEQMPYRNCSLNRRKLSQEADHLRRAVKLGLKAAQVRVESVDKLVEMASPAKILKRGFTMTRRLSGKLVRSPEEVNPGDELVTEFFAGTVKSTVHH